MGALNCCRYRCGPTDLIYIHLDPHHTMRMEQAGHINMILTGNNTVEDIELKYSNAIGSKTNSSIWLTTAIGVHGLCDSNIDNDDNVRYVVVSSSAKLYGYASVYRHYNSRYFKGVAFHLYVKIIET